jgi:hypothetical protein
MKTIRLITCNDSFEANLIKDKLEDEGIECFLTNENFTSLFPNYNGILGSGIQVMIDEKDLERATEIIQDKRSAQVIKCPNCDSDQVTSSIGYKSVNKILTILLSLLIWIPFGNIKNTYYCKNCNVEFKI